MSIVIRLQNLPSLASSEDVRHFFGDLRIFDGDITVTGGELGDAFIVFAHDDDARLAMQKNGCKIKGASVKLYLSSHTEMEQVFARAAELNPNVSHQRLLSERASTVFRYENGDRDYRPISPSRRERYSHYCRSPSPRKRSRSPRKRSISPRRWSTSSEMSSATRRPRLNTLDRDTEIMSDQHLGKSLFTGKQVLGVEDPTIYGRNPSLMFTSNTNTSKCFTSGIQFPQPMASLTPPTNFSIPTSLGSNFSSMLTSNTNTSKPFAPGVQILQHTASVPPSTNSTAHGSNLSPMFLSSPNTPKHFASSTRFLEHTASLKPLTNTSSMVSLPPLAPISTSSPSMAEPLPCVNMPPNIAAHDTPIENLCVTLSGLDPEWDMTKLQNILKGLFIPDSNIKFDLDHSGSKTGTAYLKLCNRNDFTDILSHKRYFYKYKLITVGVCPDPVFKKLFTVETHSNDSLNSERGNFYYQMKWLPAHVTCQDILDFFEGLEITDIYIVFEQNLKRQRIYGKDKLVTFVAFGNRRDYHKARSKDGHIFKGRFITLVNTTQKKMSAWKRSNKDLFLQSKSFVPVPDGGPIPGTVDKVFYAALTGLPADVTEKKIFVFFVRSGVKCNKIHISRDDKQQCNGQAFVEFKSLHLSKKALKCDGKRMSKYVISVKECSNEQKVKVEKLTSDTCEDETYENPVLQPSQEEVFSETAISTKSIKVEHVLDSAEVETRRIPLNLPPVNSLDHSRNFIPFKEKIERNACDELNARAWPSTNDSRNGCATLSSESHNTYQNKAGNLKESSSQSQNKNFSDNINVRIYPGERNCVASRQWYR